MIMAKIETISNGFLDSILPTFGNPRTNTPVWNESLKMFIINEYESAAGNRYYSGVRISDRVVIVEHVGMYHSFTYIDGMDIFMYDSEDLKLIVQEKYDKQFYNADFIRERSQIALRNYARSQAAMTGETVSDEIIEQEVNRVVANSYQSLLDDDKICKLQRLQPIMQKALR